MSDIVRGIELALESDAAVGHALNLGTGTRTTISEVAAVIAAGLGLEIEPEFNGQYRVGDIRHCHADSTRARELLGFEAKTRFADGMSDLVRSLAGQAAVDMVEQATEELAARGLTR